MGNGWTPDLLRELIAELDRRYEQRFDAQTAATAAALAAAEKANLLADANAERWRAEANEWRGAMNDRERGFMSRGEADAKWAAIEAQLALLSKAHDFSQGREKGLSLGASIIVGLIGVAGVVIGIVISLS